MFNQKAHKQKCQTQNAAAIFASSLRDIPSKNSGHQKKQTRSKQAAVIREMPQKLLYICSVWKSPQGRKKYSLPRFFLFVSLQLGNNDQQDQGIPLFDPPKNGDSRPRLTSLLAATHRFTRSFWRCFGHHVHRGRTWTKRDPRKGGKSVGQIPGDAHAFLFAGLQGFAQNFF